MQYAERVCPLILLVEDLPSVAERMQAHLCQAGFTVQVAESCAEALDILRERVPELIVLDAVLDDGSGIELCAYLRAGGHDGALPGVADTPIIVLVEGGDEEAHLRALEAGADDCLAKPVNPKELRLRVHAILRRSVGLCQAQITIGELVIDPRQRQVRAGGHIVTLAPKEFDLLHLLASNPGRVFSREDLFRRVWESKVADVETRTVDVHVSRLRQKLAIHPPCANMIGTEWRVGYKLIAERGAPGRLLELAAAA
jgi:DNA-binding response OmpR family regulator